MTKGINKSRAPQKKAASRAVSAEQKLLKANQEALKKLEALAIEAELQSDIKWCIGSYNYDHNPIGLYETAGKAFNVLNALKQTEPKKVPAKLLKDLESLSLGK